MSIAPMQGDTPLVLLINDEEWTTRSIESVLRSAGYAVLKAFSGRQGLELASKIHPDLILSDFTLADTGGIELCRALRELSTLRASTPIILFSSDTVRRSERLEAFRAGAWAVIEPPFESQELLVRLAPFIQAKREADAASETSCLDALTGLYNLQGLMRRVAEMSAETSRNRRPLACVVLGPGFPRNEAGTELTRRLGELIGSAIRLSDVAGRMGDADFVIVAPGTDEDGALRLAERMISVVDDGSRSDQGGKDLELKAGFHVFTGADPDTALLPEELLRRATSALRTLRGSQGAGDTSRIRPFQA